MMAKPEVNVDLADATNNIRVFFFAGVHGLAPRQGETAQELRLGEEMGHHLRSGKRTEEEKESENVA
jgi:hypothetical protein